MGCLVFGGGMESLSEASRRLVRLRGIEDRWLAWEPSNEQRAGVWLFVQRSAAQAVCG